MRMVRWNWRQSEREKNGGFSVFLTLTLPSVSTQHSPPLKEGYQEKPTKSWPSSSAQRQAIRLTPPSRVLVSLCSLICGRHSSYKSWPECTRGNKDLLNKSKKVLLKRFKELNNYWFVDRIRKYDSTKDGSFHFTQCMMGICYLATHSYKNCNGLTLT